MSEAAENPDTTPELGIAAEKVRFIIVKARQYDAKEGDSDPDEGSNATDDGMADVLEDKPETDAVRQELMQFINKGLDEEEQTNLVALAWVAASGMTRHSTRSTFTIRPPDVPLGGSWRG